MTPRPRLKLVLVAAFVLIDLIVTAMVFATYARACDAPLGDGDLTFTITDVERATSLAHAEFPDSLNTQAEGEFLIVKMVVTNEGDAEHTYYSTWHTLQAGGVTYENNDEAWVLAGNQITELGPGEWVETAAVFDVPVGTTPESLTLRANDTSAGVIAPL
jgi:hypothetical protein